MSGAVLLSEVIGTLAYALDLTEGEPPGNAARSCMIGMRLAHELPLDPETRSDLFYALLLKAAGLGYTRSIQHLVSYGQSLVALPGSVDPVSTSASTG